MLIVASTRPGRIGLPVAEWVAERVAHHGAFELDFADLADVDLPFMDEPHHPRRARYVHAHTKAWSARVDAADAFVIVTPEYNYGFTAPLKNAIDYLHREWKHKPVGIVSYGGLAAGTRGAQMLKQVLTTLSMVPLFEAVAIPFAAESVHDGTFDPGDAAGKSALTMLDQLSRTSAALRPLRESAQ